MGVLVTSVARKVPLLRAVRTALDRVAPGAALHGADADPQALGRFFVDRFWAMPALEALTPAEVIAYCERDAIRLVVPTRDGELAFWARHRAALEEAGAGVMVAEPAAVATCLDKLAFARALEAAGEPAIPTTTTPADAPLQVVKERFGAGGRSLGLALTRPQAEAHATTLRQPVFQPHVAGTEFSVDLYADRAGRLRGVVARRRESVVAGESQVTATVRDEPLEERCARIAAMLGLRGHACLQVIVDASGAHHVLECNARFGGASTLSLAAGLDTFAWAYLEAAGEALDDHPFDRAETELRLVRAPRDHVFAA